MEARDLELMARQSPESCFVIHKQRLIRNLEILNRVGKEAGVDVLLALKGYACHATFDTIRPYVSGIAASSPHEAELAFRKMGKSIHAYAPAYSNGDIEALLQWVDHIVFNSIPQLERFYDLAKKLRPEVSIGLRLNPEYSVTSTELYDPSSRHSRLGVRRSAWKDSALSMISGIHIHNLCENFTGELEHTLSALEKQFGFLLNQVKWINMGGGHLITHADYDVDRLIQLILDWKSRYNHQVFIEPGGAFGWETGILKGTVLDIQPSLEGDLPHAILNVSATAHMPDTLEMPYRAEIHGAAKLGEKPYAYRLGGVTCLAGDVIGIYAFDAPLQVGDPVLFMNMAHYTMVKTTFFNGVQMPAIAIYDAETQTTDVVRSFSYEDYANKLS